MSFNSSFTPVSQSVTNGVASAAMTWDLSGASDADGRSVVVVSLTSTIGGTLYVQDGPAEDDMLHAFSQSVTANVSVRLVLPIDPSCLHGKAYFVASGSGIIDLTGGARHGS